MLYYYYYYYCFFLYIMVIIYCCFIVGLSCHCYCYLSGWWFQHLWNIVSWDDEIPNIWKIIQMFQTTNQLLLALPHILRTSCVTHGAIFCRTALPRPRCRLLAPAQVENDFGRTIPGRHRGCCWWTVEASAMAMSQIKSYRMVPPSDVCWFINPIKYSYICHKP